MGQTSLNQQYIKLYIIELTYAMFVDLILTTNSGVTISTERQLIQLGSKKKVCVNL